MYNPDVCVVDINNRSTREMGTRQVRVTSLSLAACKKKVTSLMALKDQRVTLSLNK